MRNPSKVGLHHSTWNSRGAKGELLGFITAKIFSEDGVQECPIQPKPPSVGFTVISFGVKSSAVYTPLVLSLKVRMHLHRCRRPGGNCCPPVNTTPNSKTCKIHEILIVATNSCEDTDSCHKLVSAKYEASLVIIVSLA